MIIHPMTAEEALEYAPKAALLDFDGPVTPDLIAAMRDHLSYAISALAAVSAKLYEAEATIVDLHTSNLELASLLKASQRAGWTNNPPRWNPAKPKHLQPGYEGGIDPEYGTQMSFDDVPSREPIEIIDEAARQAVRDIARRQEAALLEKIKGGLDADLEGVELPAHPFGRQIVDMSHLPPLRDGDSLHLETTVEFRTDPGTYDANRGEIHRMLAEEIVAQFGNQPGADPEPEPS